MEIARSPNAWNHSINLRYILESQKLSGENFLDWEKNLRIVLDYERKLYILETEPPKTPKANARASELTSFKKYEDDARDVKCIIMTSMTAELQRLHADMVARPMIHRLRDLLQGHPKNSGIYVIEVNMSDFTSWVMDTGCGSHICTSMQNLHEVRHLTEGEVQLKVGNRALVNALAVGTYVLSLPSGLLLHLNNCLCVPAISRNIISMSCLDKAGFSINVKDKCLSVFRNDIYYETAKMTNGLYILDLDATVYNVDVKRSKPNSLNLTYLWHCHLGHINEKRTSKLRHSGVLDSFDLESYDTWLSENFAMKDLGNAGYALGIRIYRDSINDPIPLFCDNTGAIAQAKEPRSHQKTKHIVRCYHIVREIVDRGDVEICKVGTDDNIADPLTKPLGKLKHEGHTRSMGIPPMPDWP
ncbi:unnamed protein product [Cuscuta campestris]|uniref:Retrovirus-related Pol polyprotein from transposon TNT 1-94-like beta-barrel domain-containing protein n=1 Tax=Cuscuta campestris TaxID=132261 RepID=A0A484M7J9_9ASTE|nr:unnamed protein product [Cuscuta campestris]